MVELNSPKVTSKRAKAAPKQPKAASKQAEAALKPAKAEKKTRTKAANLLIVAQGGRLQFEALIFAASLRQSSPDYPGRLIIAEPQPEGTWAGHDTPITPETREVLEWLGAEIRPFAAQHFGAHYPYGNKIEALQVLPPKEPFIFFDTDTLIIGPLDSIRFDFKRPSASMRREGTWPIPPLYGPGYTTIWKSLYDRFGLDFASTLDLSQPDEHWERYLYFNAGWFFGDDPKEFGRRYLDWAIAVRDDPQEELACQSLDPWLDQIILPLVIHSFGGGRPGPELAGLDGDMTCHYRNLPLLYARESDKVVETLETTIAHNKIKKRLKEWDAARKLIYQGKGRDKVRVMFDRDALPSKEQMIRNPLKKSGWWLL